MNKEYKIKLDLNNKLYNKKMAFNQFDENVNDFYIEITKNLYISIPFLFTFSIIVIKIR